MELRFRHGIVNNQSFLFSAKESQEDYYLAAYNLLRNLLIGIAKRSRLFCSNKYDLCDYPFVYTERQLDSVLLPELASLCKGFVFAEYPVTRNSKKYDADNSKGRVDYWCIYKGFSFVIELKHSYHNYHTNITKRETMHRWSTMNKYQLGSINNDLKNFEERTNGVIRLSMHFITIECGKEPCNELIDEYKEKEMNVFERLYQDLKTIAEPDFISAWEIDEKMVKKCPYYGKSYYGLILVSKIFKAILHVGSHNNK